MSFARNLSRKHKKPLLDTGLNSLKTASKKVNQKAVEATSEFLGNKIADIIVKPKHIIDTNPINVEEKLFCQKKRRNKRIKTSTIKMEHYKISKLLNDSTVLKPETRNGSM